MIKGINYDVLKGGEDIPPKTNSIDYSLLKQKPDDSGKKKK